MSEAVIPRSLRVENINLLNVLALQIILDPCPKHSAFSIFRYMCIYLLGVLLKNCAMLKDEWHKWKVCV